jgi:hypothetical protein
MAIADSIKNLLNRMSAAARKSGLGTVLQGLGTTAESVGVLSHSFGTAHADKTYTSADLPANNVVLLTLTAADAAANVIVPATVRKVYAVVNTSGQAITVKVSGKTGIVVASTKTALLTSNGTDVIRLTADA